MENVWIINGIMNGLLMDILVEIYNGYLRPEKYHTIHINT